MAAEGPVEPWLSFFTARDQSLDTRVDLHCIGGFVVSQHYGLGRETTDLDVLSVMPEQAAEPISTLAGKGSPLEEKFRVYIHWVGVANCPDRYEDRLTPIFPLWRKLRLFALEPHDLALTKLERSSDRDIRDVVFLARAGLIRRDTLISRFEAEFEPHVTGPTHTWNRTTLQMWADACWPS